MRSPLTASLGTSSHGPAAGASHHLQEMQCCSALEAHKSTQATACAMQVVSNTLVISSYSNSGQASGLTFR